MQTFNNMYAKGGLVHNNKQTFNSMYEKGGLVRNQILNTNNKSNGGSVVVNVNFSGNVLTKSFIEKEAIPVIRNAVKRGVDIGV